MLPDTNEKARAEIAARFIDQLERMSIFVEHIDPAVANHDHALRFFLIAFNVLDFRNRRRRVRIGQREGAGFHFAESLLEELFHFAGVHVPEN